MAEEHIDLIGGAKAEVEVIESEDTVTTIIDYSKTKTKVTRMTKFQLGEGTITKLDSPADLEEEVHGVPIAMMTIASLDAEDPRELICVVDPDAVFSMLQDSLVLLMDDVRKAQLAMRFIALIQDPEHAEALGKLMARLDDDD